MDELFFLVEEDPSGGWTAKCLGHSIFTQGETLEELRLMVKDAVSCHFDDSTPKLIRLHIVRDEILAYA